MVTGSHNPADENGLKIMRSGKASFFGEDIQKLAKLVERGNLGPESEGTAIRN